MSSLLDVITTALAVPLPCPVCTRAEVCRCVKPEGYSPLAERATLIRAALVQYGHVTDPAATEPSYGDLEAAAKLLATRSRHPRYDYPEGHARLLESDRDVQVAYAQAERHGATSDDLQRLGAARDLLLDHHQTRRAAETVG